MGVLRLLLAIAVFSFHIGVFRLYGVSSFDGGSAVFCFFVVSGFYMEMVLVQKYNSIRLGSQYFKKFLAARFWRLYPTYFFIAVVSFALSVCTSYVHLPKILNLGDLVSNVMILRSLGAWFSNITMLFLNLPSTSDLLIGPGWSLGIEISFYVIAPFCLKLKTKHIIILAVIGLGLQFIPFGQHSPILFGFHFFLLGALARRYTTQIESIVSNIGAPSI
ncbi:acyltransferase family protein [Undibacterium sp.]|uniref:acyltransferase family protein n=1 Tax=Undibacterium sp. TaxID=1914977 RepID=UPI0025F7F013|nr:acyltransferase family protein [Undibacterium sp.]